MPNTREFKNKNFVAKMPVSVSAAQGRGPRAQGQGAQGQTGRLANQTRSLSAELLV